MTRSELSQYITECLLYEGMRKVHEKGWVIRCGFGLSNYTKILERKVYKVLHTCNSDELKEIETLLITEGRSEEDRSELFERLKPLETLEGGRLKEVAVALRNLVPSLQTLCARPLLSDCIDGP